MDPVTLSSKASVEHLVVDAGGFIKNTALHEVGRRIYTLPEVISEIKDNATKQRLQVLPYEIQYRVPPPEIIKIVTDFSKQTGDYPSLSAVDIKVLALTYLLEKEFIGTEHLCQKPKSTQVLPHDALKGATASPGFFGPANNVLEVEQVHNERVQEGSGDSRIKSDQQEKDESCTNESSENEESEEEETWITPSNITEIKRQMGALTVEDGIMPVACISTDFAVQNMLIQMGLKAVSVDGMMIKHARTFILRCHACFTTTKIMTKQFCPGCGNKTLKRVSVSVDEDGTTRLFINYKKPINIRGTRFSLPTPKGGKHAKNPILCEDQPVPQNRLSKMALSKVDALDPDYLSRNSPFKVNDVYSRSANLNVRLDHLGSRNPNQVKRNTGNHKKKRQ
ncbi:RNA-binding protein NOB1 [Ixodes scapularis]|uniref:RNA-binding protein NOB1 n=1 Tax=Ixodes scapularis TaxID=6945 RepID=UPI001A9EC18C|nr:RNA-binding protein NOB1 [Ixodes scapularis]